jgi:hypothetical protein
MIMRTHGWAIVAMLAVVFGATQAQAITVGTTPSGIWTLFPKNTQGENGIWLQSRDNGTSLYRTLTYAGDYAWITPGAPWGLPALTRTGTPGKITADPADENQVGHDRDTVIRVLLEGPISEVRVTGSFGVDSWGGVNSYIYKGQGNWSQPLWQGGPGQGFNFLVPCTSGDEIFFSVDAGANDMNDWARWYDLQVTGTQLIPEPVTMAGLGLGVAALSRYVRRRRAA